MADPLTILSIGSTVIGGAVSAMGQIAQGREADRAAQFEAEQLEKNAKAARATASREAKEEHRQKRLAMSRARAIGAASGSDRDFDLEGDIEAEGQYRALSAIFEGEEAAKGRITQAKARRYDGKVAKRAGFMSAGGSLLGTGASLLEKYG